MKKVNEYQLSFRKGDSGPKYLFRGPHTDWGIIILKPGETLGRHYHNEVEETFYFIEGTPIIKINETEYRTEIGDAFLIEPKEIHDIINDTQVPVKVIFIKYPYLPEDKVDC